MRVWNPRLSASPFGKFEIEIGVKSVRMKPAGEFLRPRPVIVLHKTAENIVGRNLESLNHRYGISACASFVIGYVLVARNVRHVAHGSVIGLEFRVKLHFPVFEKRRQSYGLEYRTRLGRPSCGHVEYFRETSGAVPLQVDHGTDRSGLHVHYDSAASVDVVFLRHVLPERPVGDVLHVDVYSRPHVKSVFRSYESAVNVLYQPAHVRAALPFDSGLSVQHIIIASLNADVP